MDLKGKNILFISPKYFDYERYIKETLENKGAKVFLVYENVNDCNIYYKFRFYCMKKSYDKVIDRYYIKHIENINERIDIVFAIRAECLSENVANLIKQKYPRAMWIMYQWDSIKNNKNVLNIADYFQHIYTFDPDDASKYDWGYRPLFYIDSLCDIQKTRGNDLVFIGMLHSNRIKLYKKIKSLIKEKDKSWYDYLYSSIYGYYINKYILRKQEYQGLNDCEMKFKSLSLEETNRVYDNSKIIVDYAHPEQTGYTMRTIESVGHRCKLVTNNVKIRESNIYHPNNVYIYDLEKFDIPDGFFEKEYIDLDKDVYNYYSLEGFINTIFGTN